jgi:uncharacterized protein (TIGR02001 family)
MNKKLATLAAVLFGTVSAFADGEANGPSLALNSSFGYESEYLFHSVQYGNGIITPSVNVFYGGLYAGTWFAIPIEKEAYWSDEMDLYGGYNYTVNDILSIDIGVIHFSYDNCVVGFLDEGSSTQGNLGFNFNTILKPSIYFSRDFDCKTYTIEGKLSHSFQLAKKLTLDLGTNFGHQWGEKDFVDYTFWGVKADLTYTIKEGVTLSAGPRYAGSTEEYYIGDPEDPDPSKSAVWYGLNFVSNF